MLIDWFTVSAQVLNFMILVWLMKRYLYRPILAAIDAREKAIATERDDAASKQAQALQERNDLEKKNKVFDAERASLLSQVKEQAQKEREHLLAEAREEADALKAKRQAGLAGEADVLAETISLRAQEEVFAISRKTLGDLASTSLEALITEAFIRRLHDMDASSSEQVTKALNAATEAPLVRSAFDLPSDQRSAITGALNERFSMDLTLDFETTPNLIGGIELATNGEKISWSIKAYLDAMSASVRDLITEHAGSVDKDSDGH